MRPPAFWTRRGWRAQALRPAGALYAAAGALRRRVTTPVRAEIPVICVGNPTLGGAGKTPVVQAIVAHLQKNGATPGVLLRGYRGRLSGPVLVDPDRHSAAEVGDEALLHAARAPTIVSADRPAGARLAAQAGCSCVVMDDGFQNPSLAKDLSILVIDGAVGIGNGLTTPAGPLREPLSAALARADLVVLIGQDRTALGPRLAAAAPVLTGRVAPVGDLAEGAQDAPLFAFAGIGRPDKFFATLEERGATLVGRRSFPDHHPYSDEDLAALRRDAETLGARLITTEKDVARLSAAQRRGLGTPGGDLHVLAVALRLSDEGERFLGERLSALQDAWR